jgi:biopolymer transport protein ExbD
VHCGNILETYGVSISMELIRIRARVAPALASLFVILLLCMFEARRPVASAGLRIPLYPLHPEPHPSGICNARAVIFWLDRDGKMRINETETQASELRNRVHEIFEDRTVQRAYVIADSEVSYAQFADFLGRIVGATQKLDVVLISGQLRREVETEPTFECVTLPFTEATQLRRAQP